MQKRANGDILFVPSSPRDHLALPFVAVPATDRDRALRVSFEPGTSLPAHCVAYLQDQDFHNIGGLRCGEPEAHEREFLVLVPRGVASVRLYFLSPLKKTMVLPRQLRISLHDVIPSAESVPGMQATP